MSEDQTQKFDGSDGDRLDQLIAMVQGLTVEVKSLTAQVQTIDTRMTALERKVEERLYDTRPMWEAVQSQMTEMKEEMQKSFRLLNNKFDMLNKHFSDLYADQRETERRVGELEKRIS